MNGKLIEVVQSTTADSQVLASEVIPLSFQLVELADRPAILIKHLQEGQQWTVEARRSRAPQKE